MKFLTELKGIAVATFAFIGAVLLFAFAIVKWGNSSDYFLSEDEVYYGFKSDNYENIDVFVIPNDVEINPIDIEDIDYYILYHEDNYEIVLNKHNKIISFLPYCESIGCINWEMYNQNGFYYIILEYLEDD